LIRERLRPPSQEGAQYTQEGCRGKRPYEVKGDRERLSLGRAVQPRDQAKPFR
jgi:hypothetical protein